ncbi:Spc98 family-domain-containing protein [Flagelloscypha sp. PMI_526]|nr:Spc98 family-domain-containing protein [Flagelloscypha sp. PMI_526]
MDPYTPRAAPRVRKKTLTLSAKEYTKIAGTIASSRRNRGPIEPDLAQDGRNRNHNLNEPSFIAETSFVRAPLNSRVGPPPSTPRLKGKSKVEPLDRIPTEIQEALILEDLLYVLMGIEGTYITHHPDYSAEDDDPLEGIKFVVSPHLDPSLRDLVERILPLGTYYTAISAFVEQRSHLEFGLVNHALCASIRDMLKDYQTLLSQLEHAFNTSTTFSLQKLWFYIHPTTHTLALIYTLTLELSTAVAAPDVDDGGSTSSSSEFDAEEEARNEALGLGGAKLKAVLSQIDNDASDSSSIPVMGGERQQNMSGDPEANLVYGTLLKDAGRPYLEMLKVWVTTGRLDDSYEELMVKESKFINRGILESDYTDEYWERRYTLRDGSTVSGPSKRHQAGVPAPRTVGGRLPGGACVPPLLERWKHKVLLAGKYLNVIRECGIEIPRNASPLEEDVSMADERFYNFIETAYTYANRTLLHLLLRDQQIIPRLRSLKHYFFLSHASFLTHMLDLSSGELRKTAKSVSIVKLQSLLDMALNTDANDAFQFREDVKVTMASSGLYEWLIKVASVSGMSKDDGMEMEHHVQDDKGKDDKKPILAIDAMTLDYRVTFPLSLVISRKTVLRYQLIFRFLLNLKHVEQALSSMWIEQKTTPWRLKMLGHPDFEAWRLRVFVLRARMLSFVQQILAFAAFEVLEPNWRKLEAKLDQVETVDQLLRDHVDFLDTCLKECMLTIYAASFTKSANGAISAANTEQGDQEMPRRWEFLSRFEENFNHWFKMHLDCVQFYASSENVSLLPLVVRLSSIKQ